MPLYTFVCKECEKIYEVIVPLKDYGTKVKCPHCKKKLEMKIMPVYFTVK